MKRIKLVKPWEYDGKAYTQGTVLEVDDDFAAEIVSGGYAEDEKAVKTVTVSDASTTQGTVDNGKALTVEDVAAVVDRVIEKRLEPVLKRAVNTHTNITVKEPNSTKDKLFGFQTGGHFLQAVRDYGSSGGRAFDEKLKAVSVGVGNSASESIDSDGGFLVPPQMADEIFAIAHRQAVLLPKCRRTTVVGNNLTIKANAETSRATGSRWGGIRGYWLDEAEAYTNSKPTWREKTLKLRKLGVYFPATDELLADAPALQSMVTQGVAEEMAWQIDDAILRGVGTYQPKGILNASAIISVTRTTASSIKLADIKNMWRRVLPESRRSASAAWIVHPDTWAQIISMNESVGGGTSYLPMFQAMWATGNYTPMLGKPIVECESCSTTGTVGDIVYVDLANYQVITKSTGVEQAMSMHVHFTTGETGFRWTYRIDGDSLLNSAITPANGSVTESSFVSLAT